MTSAPAMDLLRLVNGYQVTQAIHVAAALGLADHLKDGCRSSAELAQLSKTDPEALYRLLRALASVGIFREHEARRFSLTSTGDCLRSDSATPLASWANYVGRSHIWQAWGHLLHCIRTGGDAYQELHGSSTWDFFAQHPDESAIFDQAMTANSQAGVEPLLRAYDFGSLRHLVDVGGGRGQTLAAILARHPHLHGTLFDQPHVVDKAKALLESHRVSDRCSIVAGDFFESVPAGADAYLLRLIIHDWDDDQAIAILRTCRRAAAPQTKVLLIERIVAPPGEGPLAKFSDLNMLVAAGGRERTCEEYAQLFAAADFRLARTVPAGPIVNVIEAVPA